MAMSFDDIEAMSKLLHSMKKNGAIKEWDHQRHNYLLNGTTKDIGLC